MLRAVAGALFKSVRRDLAGYASLKTNNFFLFVAMLVWGALRSGVEPASAYPFLAALGVLMLFPASGDPLAKIPAVRLALWPLGRGTRAALRAASLALSPLFWVMAVLLALHAPAGVALGFVGAAAAIRLVRFKAPRRLSLRAGGPLVTNHVRQMLSVLDTWLALAIGAGGGAWRLFGHADPDAFPILSLLAAIALSTYAQCLFSLDGEGGMTRYRLLPLSRRRIVLSKDAAYLMVLLAAVLPLSVVPGLTFGLTALALGRYPAMRTRLPVERWRFTSGCVLWGALQGIAGGALGVWAAQQGWAALAVAAGLYAASLLSWFFE
jgi:hypothetical protein